MWKNIKNFLKQTFSLDEQTLVEKPKEEILNEIKNEVCCEEKNINLSKNQNDDKKIINDSLQTISEPNNVTEPKIKQLKIKTNYRKDPNYRL